MTSAEKPTLAHIKIACKVDHPKRAIDQFCLVAISKGQTNLFEQPVYVGELDYLLIDGLSERGEGYD